MIKRQWMQVTWDDSDEIERSSVSEVKKWIAESDRKSR